MIAPLLRPEAANLRTPDLRRAVADYTQVFGFECRQHIDGVCALVAHGPLRVQLWACGAALGRWERPTPGDRGFVPGHHRLEMPRIHVLHASLRASVQRPGRNGAAREPAPHAQRFQSDQPQWQPWGAWEFVLTDIDGNTLHLFDRMAHWPDVAASRQPDEQRLEDRS